MRKAILGTIITAILITGALSVERYIRTNRDVPKAQGDRKVLPADLKLKAVGSSETVTLSKFAGKVVLINFWASWCSACMDEMPSIQKLHDTLKSEGFEVVGVNVDENPETVVPAIAKKLHLSFKNYTDV